MMQIKVVSSEKVIARNDQKGGDKGKVELQAGQCRRLVKWVSPPCMFRGKHGLRNWESTPASMKIADQVKHETAVKLGNTKGVWDRIPEVQVWVNLRSEGPVWTSHIHRPRDWCKVSGIFLSKESALVCCLASALADGPRVWYSLLPPPKLALCLARGR